MKYGHIKSRLDECKKFDEECRLRYVADKMMRLYKVLRCQTCTEKPSEKLTLQQWVNKYEYRPGHVRILNNTTLWKKRP